MTLCKDAGLADPNCQLYMLFYYLGPASVGLLMLNQAHEGLPSWPMILRAASITLFDIAAQALNYTGAALAGPTIFAIVYSSVTVWTAVFSRILLKRHLLPGQWIGIVIVFSGLALTATDNSVQVGSGVSHGLLLVTIGSAMHGLTYVMCEIVMVVPDHIMSDMPRWLQMLMGDKNTQRLSVVQNTAVQGFFAMSSLLVWQLVYTLPRMDEFILEPMHEAGTSYSKAAVILGSFALANLVHALSYFFTLRHFPGGATSAGVMKGLQAVLVFVVTAYFYCGVTGGSEMCFSPTKFSSLVTVVGGVALFGVYTEKQHRLERQRQQSPPPQPQPQQQSIQERVDKV
ncbi:Transporter permease protein [Seminavis robusta]|uniref:Transporter permease protein n=1 Tax=Seminavis robusta TaxID=568900 RepID=A0A9N8H1X2_9STRA|nr:Transporter permease protein [Seminavis robusta]|eukprot:Sro9_g007330.1 Transporter permease protein (343) ;mRNA; f:118998-120026